jgi:1-deoxy-D-xylulose-5-phosphate synthase
MQNPIDKLNIDILKRTPLHDLPMLAKNIRDFLIKSTSETGGHIGANLGVVELTIAMHYVFSSPKDVFIFDTGHIGYTHKILTERTDKFKTLNTYGGMNRFISRSESEHDFIEASHAGTSISVGLGRAISARNKGDDYWTIVVIGDGALSEGVALEALNHASVEENIKLLIVLNDNAFAISPGFGAIHNYLQNRSLKKSLPNETFFTSLGYNSIGPVDGHSIEELIKTFKEIKLINKVSIMHAKTEKGKGLEAAKNNPFKMHYSFPFDVETGLPKTSDNTLPPYQNIASEAIEECMAINQDIIAITPSTLYATGLSELFKKFPHRCFDPGMEEQHAMSMAVGMALNGSFPVLFYQSTFLQRAFDQLIHDVCFTNQDMLILTVRSGFSGYDNPTHHGIYDFSYLKCLPNLIEYYPKDAFELYNMVKSSLSSKRGPVMIHMPYASIRDQNYKRPTPVINFDDPELIINGTDGIIISIGNKVFDCEQAIKILKKANLNYGLINIRKIKPLNEEKIISMIKNFSKIVTVEENVLEGGFGSSISSLMHSQFLKANLLQIGLPCKFIEGGSTEELSHIYEIDAESIAKKIKQFS